MSIRKQPTFHKYENGLIMGGSVPRPHFWKFLTYSPNEDDIFICSYPKCGTTWMQNILYLMSHRGTPLGPHQKIKTFIPQLEWDEMDDVHALSKPRIWKTHLPYHMVPKSNKSKYIYVARNPKDCCVSFYHHTKGFSATYDFVDGSFDDFFELFMKGEVSFNDFFDHLLSYYEHKDNPNVLFILYEDLKSDIHQCLRKIGLFLGGIFEESVRDLQILNDVVRHSSFSFMKATPSVWSMERAKGSEDFIRKGQVESWTSLFSEDQSRLMDQKLHYKLDGTGAEFLWKM